MYLAAKAILSLPRRWRQDHLIQSRNGENPLDKVSRLRWLPYDLCVGRCLAQWRKPIFKSFDIRGPQGVEDPARRTKLMSGTALTALGSLYYDEPTSLVGLSFPGTRHPTTNPFRNNMQHTTSNSHKLPFI